MTLIADMAELDSMVLETLGEWFLVGGGSNRVRGIFQDSFVVTNASENTTEGREVLFTCRLSDLPTLEHRVTTFVSNPNVGEPDHGSYIFLRSEPDESGMTRCILGVP
jgi:hypothetical protein